MNKCVLGKWADVNLCSQVQKMFLATGNDRLKLVVLYSGEEDERLRRAAAGTLAMLTAEQPELCTRIPETVSTHAHQLLLFFSREIYKPHCCPFFFPDNPLAGDYAGTVAQWNLWSAPSWSGHHSEHDAGRQKSCRDPDWERGAGDPLRLGQRRRGHNGSCLPGGTELLRSGCGVWNHQEQGRKWKRQERNRTMKTLQRRVEVPSGDIRSTWCTVWDQQNDFSFASYILFEWTQVDCDMLIYRNDEAS